MDVYAVIFSAKDIDYLVKHFDHDQLRYELHHAELEAAASTYYEDDWEYYWSDYCEAVQMAIDIVKGNTPKPLPSQAKIDVAYLKATNDIVAVIERYTILKKAGKNFTGLCIFHNEKNPSLIVYPDSQRYHCYGCQADGDVFKFVQRAENCDFKQAAAILGA